MYQIATNGRTSVDMIEKHYAAHIKTNLYAAAINVRRHKPATRTARSMKKNPRSRGGTAQRRRFPVGKDEEPR